MLRATVQLLAVTLVVVAIAAVLALIWIATGGSAHRAWAITF